MGEGSERASSSVPRRRLESTNIVATLLNQLLFPSLNDTYVNTDNLLAQAPDSHDLISDISCKVSHSRGTGYGLLAGAATVGLFKQNGTFSELNRP